MDSQSIEHVIGKKFIKKKSTLGEKERETYYVVEECNIDEFSTCKYVLLFFSAGWCPPCEQFVQVLKDFYHEINIDQKLIEVVYVSCDKQDEEFKKTYAKMPWITFPFSNSLHKELVAKYEICGVPMIYVLDA